MPNIEEPILTKVESYLRAFVKSPDMPMLNSFKPSDLFNSIKFLKCKLSCPSFGGIAISPRTFSFKFFVQYVKKSSKDSTGIPDFWFSFPMLTCIKYLIFLFNFASNL